MALKVHGIGRLAVEPKLEKTTTGISVLKISLAFNDGFGDYQRTDFVNCVFWKGSAEAIAKHCKKGDRLSINGKIQTSQWEVEGGGKRYATEVLVTNFEFIEPREQQAQSKVDGDMPF